MKHPKTNSARQFFFSLFFVLWCFAQSPAQNNPALRQLSLNVPIEDSIAAGETQTFTLRLDSNQFIAVALEQKGFDATLSVDEMPGGEAKRLLTMNWNPDYFGYERVLFQNKTGSPLDLLFRVSATEKTAAGKFSLALTELKAPEAKDNLRIAAQTAISDARNLYAESKSELKEQARRAYQNALQIVRRSGDRELEIVLLLLLQHAFREAGDKVKSIAYGKEALAVIGEHGNDYDRARAKAGIGETLVSMGEVAEGIGVLSEVLIETRKFGDRSMEIAILTTIGVGYQRFGEAEKALQYLGQAEQLAKNIGDKFGQIEALRVSNRVYYDRGDFHKSIEVLNQALALSEGSFPEFKPLINSELVANFVFLGQMQKALDYLQQSLAYYRNVSGNKWNEAATLERTAQIYSYLGQSARALEYNRQATELYAKLAYPDALIAASRTRGEIYRALKNFAKARESHLESVRLAEQKNDKHLSSAAYDLLAFAEKKLGNYESALTNYLKAAELRGELKLKGMQSASLVSAADLYIFLGQPAKAAEVAAQSLEYARAAGDRITESNALYQLARVKRVQNDPVEALKLIENSIKIVESLRAEIISRATRTAYFSTVRDKYDFYIGVLIELRKKQGNTDFGARAFEASERARARGLLDLLAESYTDVSSGISPELKKREREIEATLSALQTQLIRLKSTDRPDTEQVSDVQNKIKRADDEREHLESEIRRANPRYAELKYPAPLNLAQTQAILDEKTVLLEYQLGADASFLFAVGKNAFQVVLLPGERNLRESIEPLRRSISLPTRAGLANYLVASRRLYGSLIAPVEHLLKDKIKIIVSADGALNYLPFEVLLTNDTPGGIDKLPYLVRNFEISYTPSASVLANLNSAAAPGAKPAKSFLAFAAPDYGIKSAVQNQLAGKNTRTVFGENREWDLTDLPHARLEAERIAKLFPAGQSTVYAGSLASEDRAKSNELLSQYRYLHFAVHGLIDEEQPQFSSLVLSLPRTSDQSAAAAAPVARGSQPAESKTPPEIADLKSAEDGLLQTPEIFNLRLRADLVTLSACETGLGQEMRGEGIIGLTRAFFYAGTPSVLVSLWKVDDASTAELMTNFYEQLRKDNGRSKAAALRRAQLKLIGENRYAHPYYWAAFILQGKTESALNQN